MGQSSNGNASCLPCCMTKSKVKPLAEEPLFDVRNIENAEGLDVEAIERAAGASRTALESSSQPVQEDGQEPVLQKQAGQGQQLSKGFQEEDTQLQSRMQSQAQIIIKNELPTPSTAGSGVGQNHLQQQPRQRISQLELNKKNLVFDHLDKEKNIREDYRMGAVLGSGAYGEVRSCVHLRTKAQRAVKIINQALMSKEEQKRMMEEINILKGLDHPNILKIYEAYKDSKNFYIVTELLKGGELFDMIVQRAYFQERDAAKILHQIFIAISHCHSKNIVHRDIKPENILLENNQSGTDSLIKIIDFGTSLQFDPSKKLKQTIGTPYYIAPEVLQQTYDSKCDIWSCGVIMYILLSGKPPFDGNDDEEILRAVDKARVSYSDEVWKKVSPEGKDLLKKMLEKNYKKRISAVECLEHPWFAKFLASQDLSTQESNEANMNIMANIKSFTGRLKMQQAALSFISVHLMSNEEQEQMRKVFQSIDKDFDGVLDRQELIEGLKKMGIENPSAEADRIFEMADLDQNGTIEFSEWVTATMDKRQMLNKQRLKAAFDMFDRNQDGTISFEEVREILGGGKKSDSASDNMFKEMIREMDVDGDGQISYEEFEQMMTQMIQGKQ